MNYLFAFFSFFLSMNSHSYYCEPATSRPPIFNRTIDTIGDSITWNNNGAKLRCMLAGKGVRYDYVGSFVDPFGYRHDGHGGDTTQDVIDRMGSIPFSDSYFVLIGVNEGGSSARHTFINIQKIAEMLHEKNSNALIYISTLLPAIGPLHERNNAVNELLRTSLTCKNCFLVDTNRAFTNHEDWEFLILDDVHLTEKGYDVITDYLSKVLV